MVVTYDIGLAVLSFIIAVLASFVALDLASRVVAAEGETAARYWLNGGALSMGAGIWSMNFIGMLAVQLPIPVSYDVPITLLSLLVAIAVAGFALHMVSRESLSTRGLLAGGVLMGIGIASMHYIGMAAMQLEPPIRYDPLLLSLSILIAIATSVVALWLAFHLRGDTILTAFWKKGGSALVMGAAICGMFYAGMAATIFAPTSVSTVSPQDIDNVWLGGTIGGFTFVFMATTLLICVIDARLGDRSTKLAEKLRRVNIDLEQQHAELSRTNVLLQQQMQERMQAEKAMRESEERYRQLVELSPDSIYVQSEGKIAFVNSACVRLFGANKADELVGKSAVDLFHVDYHEIVKEYRRQIGETPGPTPLFEAKVVRLDGAVVDVEASGAPFVVKEGKLGTQVVMRDITQRKKADEQILYLAQYDVLTGLPNRNLFRDRLSHAVERAKRNEQMLAVMFLDLDRFKEINDTLGHRTGDKVLQAVTERLRKTLRGMDSIARLGGDEFTIVLEDVTDVDQVTTVAERIQEAFFDPIIVEDREIFLTASTGVTLYPLNAVDIDELLQTADVAMYRAKADGPNTYEYYAPEMNASAAKHLHMEGLLRRATERDEFLLHYQPKVEVQSGRIIGAEALIRWNSKELGLVSPGQFIPLAEKTGLIVPISEWVLKTACAQNKAWQRQGFPSLLMSVNLSPRQFRQKNLVGMIAGMLHETGLEPRFLDLEITEGTMMRHPDEAVALLQQLHRLGVQFSVDDFGTGYSSLAYLKRFPVQRLKIDQSFVRHLITDADDAGIVTAVIAMAKSLGLGVVAEGVETEEQLAYLANLQCDEYQGYYFSRPLSAEEFVRLLRTSFRVAHDVNANLPVLPNEPANATSVPMDPDFAVQKKMHHPA